MPKKVSKRSIKGDGRPSKLTPAVLTKLKEAFAYGLTDDQAAALVGVNAFTLTLWKRNPAFMKEIQGSVTERLLVRLKRIEAGENGWQGCGWILERLLPRQWAKPEILVAIQNNTLNQTTNQGLVIEAEVASEINVRVQEAESKIDRLLKGKRPVHDNGKAHGNGDGTPERRADCDEIAGDRLAAPTKSRRWPFGRNCLG